MSHLEFIHGYPFTYAGHLERLTDKPLFFDAQVQQVVDETCKEEWPAFNITKTNFMLFKKSTGNIRIDYTECTLYVPQKKNS